MARIWDFPLLVFVLSFLVLWLSTQVGIFLGKHWHGAEQDTSKEAGFVGFVLSATLALLGLIIGFTFSMAISRYDQRKNYEAAEANAIGTQILRADLLPVADAVKVRVLLRSYLDQRVLFYTTRNAAQIRQINERTAQLQVALWSSILGPAAAKPTPIIGLAVSGMNDVLNARDYTQAAWWNRIPVAAWMLMATISICCNVLIGFNPQHPRATSRLLLILPFVVAVSFFLIADIDSPRWGVIHVGPENMISLVESLRAQSTGSP